MEKWKFCKLKWHAYISTVQKVGVWVKPCLTSDFLSKIMSKFWSYTLDHFVMVSFQVISLSKIYFQIYVFIYTGQILSQNLLNSKFAILAKYFFFLHWLCKFENQLIVSLHNYNLAHQYFSYLSSTG